MWTVYTKKGNPVYGVNSLLSFTSSLLSSPSLFSSLSVTAKTLLPALFLPFWCPFLTPLSLSFTTFSHLFQLLFPVSIIPTSPICPTCLRPPPLCMTPTPPHLYSPSTPTRMAIKAEGNSLDLKISMSLSLCSCRVASPKAAPRYGWPCLFASSGVRTHTHNTHHRAHTLSKGHSKAVITCILQLCYYRYPPSSQSGLSPFQWVHSREKGAQKVPSPITQLLAPNTSLLHYLLYLLLSIYYYNPHSNTRQEMQIQINITKSTMLYFTASLPQ